LILIPEQVSKSSAARAAFFWRWKANLSLKNAIELPQFTPTEKSAKAAVAG